MSALPVGEPWADQRRWMVLQLRAEGIAQPQVLAAMAAVPRHLFVPADERTIAYADRPLPIGCGQAISQPYIVARMAELLDLRTGARVLDIGGGSGYAAAVCSRIAAYVVTVERLHTLAERARALLAELQYTNVLVVEGDGWHGYLPAAPYTAIHVAAAAGEVPEPLLEQLADGGRLVMPIGAMGAQQLVRIIRHGARFERQVVGEVAFVPLVRADEAA